MYIHIFISIYIFSYFMSVALFTFIICIFSLFTNLHHTKIIKDNSLIFYNELSVIIAQ